MRTPKTNANGWFEQGPMLLSKNSSPIKYVPACKDLDTLQRIVVYYKYDVNI